MESARNGRGNVLPVLIKMNSQIGIEWNLKDKAAAVSVVINCQPAWISFQRISSLTINIKHFR